MRLLDTLLSRTLEVAIILTWHGVWSLMDIILEEKLLMTRNESSWMTLYIGVSGAVLMYFYQFMLLVLYNSPLNNCLIIRVIFFIFYYIFLFIGEYLAFLNMFILIVISGLVVTIASFRSAWYLLDEYYLPDNLIISWWSALIIGVSVLISLRTVTCLHAGIIRDSPR